MRSNSFDVNGYIGSLPVVTKILLLVNILIYCFTFLSSSSLATFSISAAAVLPTKDIHTLGGFTGPYGHGGEVYRILSSAFTHSGLLHIFFNMSSLLQLGMSLEYQFGSTKFFLLTLWSILLIGLGYIAIAWLLTAVTGQLSYWYTSAVGYSGVLFAYAVIESFHTTEPSRSVFGFFNVPAKIYPFILLIILQFILPNISFMGHLSGVLIGLLAVSGVMDSLFLPSTDAFQIMDDSAILSRISSSSSFVRDKNKPCVLAGANSTCHIIWNGIYVFFTSVLHVIQTLLYIIGLQSLLTRGSEVISTCCRRFANLFRRSNPSNPGGGNGSLGTAFQGRGRRLAAANVSANNNDGLVNPMHNQPTAVKNGSYVALATSEDIEQQPLAL